MTTVAIGRGVFRQLMHKVKNDTQRINFYGVVLWFATCGSACQQLLHANAIPSGIPLCDKCFPSGFIDIQGSVRG